MDHSNSQSPGRPTSSKGNHKRSRSNSPEPAVSMKKSKQAPLIPITVGEMVKAVGSEVDKELRLDGCFCRHQTSSLLDMLCSEIENWIPTNQPISVAWDLCYGTARDLVDEISTTNFDSTSDFRKSMEKAIDDLPNTIQEELLVSISVGLKDGKPSLRQQVLDLEEKVREERRKNERICEKMERHASVIELAAEDLKSYVADARI